MPLLLCQKDSYQRSVMANVVSCAPADGGYAVVLDGTVFYPEGGGQPSDHGTIAGFPVNAVSRGRDGEVVHVIDNAVVGHVEVAIDWARRFDHMQQHTAQHILTAVAQDRFGLATTAFHLGPDRCDIEVDAAAVPAAKLSEIEAEVNTVIRADLPVTATEVPPEALGPMKVRMRGLPEGLAGPLRVVEIVGVDKNTCGGTHVRRTAEVQALKITGTEPMRGGTRVFFLAGGRVLEQMHRLLERERALTKALQCAPAEHEALAVKLAAESKRAAKERRALLLELAGHLGATLTGNGPVAHLHRPDGDAEFARAVATAAAARRPDLLVLVTIGGEAGEGAFCLAGPEPKVTAAGPKVAEALGGRGGGAKGVFQGKAAKMEERAKALEIISATLS